MQFRFYEKLERLYMSEWEYFQVSGIHHLSSSYSRKQKQIEACFGVFMSIVNLFKESRARLYRGPEQRGLLIPGIIQAHILYLSRIEISALVGNLDSKRYPEVGNFELKSYRKGWEV